MKRLAVSLCALILSAVVALGVPGRLNAAPPPPCPDDQWFEACEAGCPGDLDWYCRWLAGNPPNCQVDDKFCVWGENPLCEGPNYSIFCHYRNG